MLKCQCHCVYFQMFENPLFSTPPGSPPPHMQMGGDFKLSSVSWCTDYLEVMGCEKPHNFKVSTDGDTNSDVGNGVGRGVTVCVWYLMTILIMNVMTKCVYNWGWGMLGWPGCMYSRGMYK